MSSLPLTASPAPAAPSLSRGMVLLMAVSCGLTVANLYYNQPLLADIGRSFGMDAQRAGYVSMLTQIGYATGLFLFIPLGDIRERRRLITSLLLAVAAALVGVATAQTAAWLYAASYLVGVMTVAPQMIIPLAAQLAPPAERGRIIGNVMSGLLIGILLARTVSGSVGDWIGWRGMYGLAALFMLTLAYILHRRLPISRPEAALRYPALIRSIGTLIVQQRTLREAAMIAASVFGAFSVFWTALTFYLEGPGFGYGSEVAGLFGLVGVAGAGAAPIIGRLSDRIRPRLLVGVMIGIALLAYVCYWLFGAWLWGLVLGVFLMDLGVQGSQVTNQTRIYSMLPEARSRLNTVFMVSTFLGGAIGSTVGAFAWHHWGWNGVCAVGGGLAALALLVWGIHRLTGRDER